MSPPHRPDFDAFYYASYPRLLRTLVLLAASRQEAEDAAAEAFTRALARWSSVRSKDDPEAWVRRVALNLVTDQHRRRGRDRRVRHLLPGAEHAAGPDASARADLVTALRALPVAQQRVLVLHHLADRSVEQVAAELDMPTGTVKSHLSRGRAALAAALAPRGASCAR